MSRLGWHTGTCDDCGRETRVIEVPAAGARVVCLVCLDKLAETGQSTTGDRQ